MVEVARKRHSRTSAEESELEEEKSRVTVQAPLTGSFSPLPMASSVSNHMQSCEKQIVLDEEEQVSIECLLQGYSCEAVRSLLTSELISSGPTMANFGYHCIISVYLI